MWSLMVDVCRAMGVRTNVPFRDLTPEEKDIVYHGPAIKKHILYKAKSSNDFAELDFTYYNAVYTVENALGKVKDESGMKRVEKFLKQEECPACHGTRLSQRALSPRIDGLSLADCCRMPLSKLVSWVQKVPSTLPEEMQTMAKRIVESFLDAAKRLLDLGLGYLTLDRSGSTLSTGERQRMQLARAVRNRTTGVLYVLDEPSIGLHPENLKGLLGVMDDLISDGNSILLVDHDVDVLKHSDYMIEMGKGAGKDGGEVLAEGKLEEIKDNPSSLIAPFLKEDKRRRTRPLLKDEEIFKNGRIHLETSALHTVRPLSVDFPKGRLVAITGVSGSGKTTLILESLVPALMSKIKDQKLPSHVKRLDECEIRQCKLIDATPIGINVRSTVATYADVHDELRKIFARQKDSKEKHYKASDFSYNTGKLRCPICDGTGIVNLDVQFLPDVTIPCPECRGTRYRKEAQDILYRGKDGTSFSLPELMAMDVHTALEKTREMKLVQQRLQVLEDLGLGYLTLGEETPSLSGGEAQRLKLAFEMGRGQEDSLFVFDEPTIGLHPLDVKVLLSVFQGLIDKGATLIVIEHDLDVIQNADYVIDMGPGGGEEGGEVVCCGTVEEIRRCPESRTGRYL